MGQSDNGCMFKVKGHLISFIKSKRDQDAFTYVMLFITLWMYTWINHYGRFYFIILFLFPFEGDFFYLFSCFIFQHIVILR
jgi:hypothetical protein